MEALQAHQLRCGSSAVELADEGPSAPSACPCDARGLATPPILPLRARIDVYKDRVPGPVQALLLGCRTS